MATERQIAANRANAKRSTGPKTAAGKMKSSRNAYRHGLSCSLPLNSAESLKADAIAHALTCEGAPLTIAAEFAQAQSGLLRIRRVRSEMLARMDFSLSNTKELRRLAALDRYERLTQTKRRRASLKL